MCLYTGFKFNGDVYEQIKWISMGSLTEAVENIALPRIPPKFGSDMWIILSSLLYAQILKRCRENNVLKGIFSIIESEKNVQLAFMYMLVKRNANCTLETRVCRNQTHTDQVINFYSNHLNNHRWSCIRTLFKGAKFTTAQVGLKNQEKTYLCMMFEENGYPRNFVRRTLHTINKEKNRKIILPYIWIYRMPIPASGNWSCS